MAKIQILDNHIANQIAAGEVVERPSSVVKELVENAIDAGSTLIDVTIEEGGLQLIRVLDNGSGIEGEDCELAFYRHATSKISSNKDLFQIRTLGFRGEALPSIAAVAKVDCTSSTQLNGLGQRIVIEGGTLQSVGEVMAPKGTDFQVKELFYNTPARLKYMKSIQTELGHISDYIYRLAMAYPNIAFTLKHNGNLLLQTLGNGDLLQVIAAIYGSTAAKTMLQIQGESLDYSIAGFISKPELTRANRTAISMLINGRYIRNYALAQTILQAYHTLLPLHRFPLAVVHIQMDPSLLDVNVHPAKLEVRFSKEAELLQVLEQTVNQGLKQQILIPHGAKNQPVKPVVVQEQLELYRPVTAEWKPETGVAKSNPDATRPDKGYLRKEENDDQRKVAPVIQHNQTASFGKTSSQFAAAKPLAAEPFIQQLLRPAQAGDQPASLPPFPKLQPIGQLHGTYIVAQNSDGLFLLDQHAAHERINYEYYYERFGHPEAASQELLVPITLDFTPADAEQLKGKLSIFAQVGVYMESFGGNTFIVRAYPHWFPTGTEKDIIEEMAEWILAEKRFIDIAKLREKSSTLCSCKASIKANQNLSRVEMEGLLDRLGTCANPYTCPHGRPIVISFTTYELEKMFKRIM